MSPNLLIYHFHPPLSFCNHVYFLTVPVFHFYKIAYWYQFLLLKYFTYYDCSSLRLSLKGHYFFMPESYSILYIYDFFIHSSVHVQYGYFHVSAVVNAAAVHCLCVVVFSWYFYLAKPRQSPWDTQSPFPSLSPWCPSSWFLCLWSQLL